jgi:hypothetical protein
MTSSVVFDGEFEKKYEKNMKNYLPDNLALNVDFSKNHVFSRFGGFSGLSLLIFGSEKLNEACKLSLD